MVWDEKITQSQNCRDWNGLQRSLSPTPTVKQAKCSKNFLKMTEWLRMKEKSECHLVQSLCLRSSTYKWLPVSIQPLNSSKEKDCTTLLSQCLPTCWRSASWYSDEASSVSICAHFFLPLHWAPLRKACLPRIGSITLSFQVFLYIDKILPEPSL